MKTLLLSNLKSSACTAGKKATPLRRSFCITNPSIQKATVLGFGCLLFAIAAFCKADTPVESTGNETRPTDATGFLTLFDGKTLDGWKAYPEATASDWSVVDGSIVGSGSADRQSYLVWKDREISDFELRLRYRLKTKGNTGVEIRAIPDGSRRRPFEGYHADLGHVDIGPNILGAWDLHFAKNPARQRKSHTCPRGTHVTIDEHDETLIRPIENPIAISEIHDGDWNDIRVTARGYHFEFYINGKHASSLTDNASFGRLDKGAIGLQIHDRGMRVEFQDIQLKRFD